MHHFLTPLGDINSSSLIFPNFHDASRSFLLFPNASRCLPTSLDFVRYFPTPLDVLNESQPPLIFENVSICFIMFLNIPRRLPTFFDVSRILSMFFDLPRSFLIFSQYFSIPLHFYLMFSDIFRCLSMFVTLIYKLPLHAVVCKQRLEHGIVYVRRTITDDPANMIEFMIYQPQ